MLCSLAYAENPAPTMQEFYATSDIEVIEDKPLQQSLVPYHVYQMVKSSNLNDVRIFNASNGLVPHRVTKQKQDSLTNVLNLPFSKLTKNSDGLESLIEKYNASGVDISLNLRAMDAATSNSEVDVYIGEIVKFEGKGKELRLDWELSEEVSAFFTVDIDLTNDFKNWDKLVSSASLAQLKTNESIVKHNRIMLNHFGKKFYRISIHGERRPDIKKVELVVSHQKDRPYNETGELLSKHDEKNKQILYFAEPSRIIKKQLQVSLSENNVMAECSVYSRDTDDNDWSLRGSGTVYKITNNGKVLQNEVIQLRESSDREWKLVVTNSGSGFEQQPPTMKFLWQPHELTFVARGGAPFKLAYGSADYAGQSVSQNSFFNTAQKDEAKLIGFSSVSNKVDVLGGDEVLDEDFIKVTPKKMMLWAILVIGSLLLLFMAISMLKSTAHDQKET